MSDMEMASAEAAAIAGYEQNQGMRRGRKMVLGIDVAPYAGYRMPGLDRTQMFSNPGGMLKTSKPDSQYVWRKPGDTVTVSLVQRGVLRAVATEEVDTSCPWATVDSVKMITANGPRQMVRTPAGLALFEIRNADALTNADAGLLPGSHWENQYLSDLSDQQDEFAGSMEQLSNSSIGGRVSGAITVKETQREVVAQ